MSYHSYLKEYIKKKFKCSYQDVEYWLASDKVRINESTENKNRLITPYDKVEVNEEILQNPSDFFYLSYYKPVGVECTLNKNTKDNLIEATGIQKPFFPVGRLDKHSEGLILLTNDGWFYNTLAGNEKWMEKEYVVTVTPEINATFLYDMSQPMYIQGKLTRPCVVSAIDAHTFSILLTEGRNRQIRRMCASLGYDVIRLQRIRIHHFLLNQLKEGEVKELHAVDIQAWIRSLKQS
ncbi:MAG: pseudouridine synthase [Cytophagaceae bacterium]|jgi:pseudouridine synthase|nr:pseudouridine synthase [Cytophagaceae bacterium]